jgi:hypothetical protein
MGIDIYLRWDKQTEEESKAQATGFATDAGDVGYLREAYHGGPYVTRFFLKEAFDAKEGEAEIPASVLKERLPVAVMMAMFRHSKLYGGDKHPEKLELEEDTQELAEKFKSIFENEVTDSTHDEVAKQMDADTLATAQRLIDGKMLPYYAQAFVDFAELAERKEKLIGRPCVIYASY